MATAKRKKKIDADTVSKQSHELKYVQSRFKDPMSKSGKITHPPISIIRDVHKQVGTSRRKTYARLEEMGYVRLPLKRKKPADKQGDGDATN